MDLQNTATELFLGIDIGSTTAKIVLREGDTILLERYERHFSQVREKTAGAFAPCKGNCGRQRNKGGNIRLSGLGACRGCAHPVCAGGFRHGAGGKAARTRYLLRYRARRRGREDNFL